MVRALKKELDVKGQAKKQGRKAVLLLRIKVLFVGSCGLDRMAELEGACGVTKRT
jgi:hypothetical protein